MANGFMYFVAIMDWHSRRVLSWRVSNTLHPDFCVEALEDALARHGRAEIFSSQNRVTAERLSCTLFNKWVHCSFNHDRYRRWGSNSRP